MKKIIVIAIIVFISACGEQHVKPQKVQVINFEQFDNLIKGNPQKLQVINFWATWCKPCIDELPAFEKLQQAYKDELDVILISLDDVKQIDKTVNPFLKKNNIQSQVQLLDHDYAAEYIPLVDSHWDGAIPVTLIKHKDKKQFYNQDFDYNELKTQVETFLKN